MISAVIIEGVTFPVAYNGYTYSRNKILNNFDFKSQDTKEKIENIRNVLNLYLNKG